MGDPRGDDPHELEAQRVQTSRLEPVPSWDMLKTHRDLRKMLTTRSQQDGEFDGDGLCLGYDGRVTSIDFELKCSNYNDLILDGVRLPGGALPDVFSSFTALRRVDLRASGIRGTLPSTWPKSLMHLDVSCNPDLDGVI